VTLEESAHQALNPAFLWSDNPDDWVPGSDVDVENLNGTLHWLSPVLFGVDLAYLCNKNAGLKVKERS
jgi:hypothetical protein